MTALAPDGQTPKLELRGVRKVFDGVEAVKGSNLSLQRGEFLSLLGPSGCGKSTTLAMIAGFQAPSAGEICIDGQVVNATPVQKRRVGLVFQDYAVFSRLTVRQNLLFGLEAQGVARAQRRRTVERYAADLGLENLLQARGDTLNMSEMQRVALARVLVTKPALLLLDEPMSNLDAALRASLRSELKQIQRDLGQTVLYVTHDQVEAMSMSDRIAVMNEGEIVQTDTPLAIFDAPRNRFVAEFIGDPPINMLACTVAADDGSPTLSTGVHRGVPLTGVAMPSGSWLLGLRPHQVTAAREAHPGSAAAPVRLVENFGSEHVLHLRYGEELLTVTVSPGFAREGDTVHLSFDPRDAHLLDPDSGEVVHCARQEQAA